VTPPRQKPHRSKQDYATPKVFLDPVKAYLGLTGFGFAFDFAADQTNAVANRWWGVEVDSLSMPRWELQIPKGQWGWLNPPFANIGPWAKRCLETREAGGQIAFLVPASVGSNWFRDYINDKAFWLALNGRIPFMPDKPKWLYPKDCMLVLFSQKFKPGYEVWTWR
jgi:hypothetical protein